MKLRALILGLTLWAGLAPAFASETFMERRISCAAVRLALKRYDAATLEMMARAKGVSDETIIRLKKCVP